MARGINMRMTWKPRSLIWNAYPIIYAAASITIRRRKAEKSFWRRGWKRSSRKKKNCDAPRASPASGNQSLKKAKERSKKKDKNSLFNLQNYQTTHLPIYLNLAR